MFEQWVQLHGKRVYGRGGEWVEIFDSGRDRIRSAPGAWNSRFAMNSRGHNRRVWARVMYIFFA